MLLGQVNRLIYKQRVVNLSLYVTPPSMESMNQRSMPTNFTFRHSRAHLVELRTFLINNLKIKAVTSTSYLLYFRCPAPSILLASSRVQHPQSPYRHSTLKRTIRLKARQERTIPTALAILRRQDPPVGDALV